MDPSPSPALPELVLYTSAGCHLCDDAFEAIERVLDGRRRAERAVPILRTVDIAADPALESTYRERIPVVACGGERLELIVGERRLTRLLERVLDGLTAA